MNIIIPSLLAVCTGNIISPLPFLVMLIDNCYLKPCVAGFFLLFIAPVYRRRVIFYMCIIIPLLCYYYYYYSYYDNPRVLAEHLDLVVGDFVFL